MTHHARFPLSLRRSLTVALCVLLGALAGCEEFPTENVGLVRGTLGEEIYQVFCERFAHQAFPEDASGLRWKPVCEGREAPPADAPDDLLTLADNRERLVAALDQTLPEAMYDELSAFMGELLPLIDPPTERVPEQTRKIAEFVGRLSGDTDALAALERLGTREGYRPPRLTLGVVRPALSYPRLNELSGSALALLGSEGAAHEPFVELQRALAVEMATLEPSAPTTPGERSTMDLVRELSFTENDGFASGTARWIVARDERGLAVPDRPAGTLPPPFADVDGDDLPDVDELNRFVDASGNLITDLPAPYATLEEVGVPRDSGGRALRPDATRYYRYFDADRTMLAGLLRELEPFFAEDDPLMIQAARGLPPLLGPEAMGMRRYGDNVLRYTTFDTTDSPVLDAVHAFAAVADREELERGLSLLHLLMRDHEGEAAGVVHAANFMNDAGDAHPEAELEQPSLFWDDLIDLVVRIAQTPGMLEAVMRSFEDPNAALLGEIYGSMMRYRDRVTYDPANVNGPPLGLPLDQAVDRSRPDTMDNESLFQRTLALIDGLNGVEVCNRDGAVMRISLGGITLRWPLTGTARACEIIRIRNVAEAYARAINGDYELEMESGFLSFVVDAAVFFGIDVDTALERASGIDGLTRHPTPQALNRLVFWGMADASGTASCSPPAGDGAGNCNSDFAGHMFAPVRDRHGNLVIERFHGTIFSWEQPGFYEGMRPLTRVLHDPRFTYIARPDHYAAGRCPSGSCYAFGDLLTTVHQHWASRASDLTQRGDPAAPNFSYQSDARSYEELIAEGFVEGELTVRLHDSVVASSAIEVEPGIDGVRALADLALVMVDPAMHPGLRARDGRDMLSVNDGSREVAISPLLLILDALNEIDAIHGRPENEQRRAAWRRARSRLADQLLGTRTFGDRAELANRRAHAIMLVVLPFLRDRIEDHRARGDLEEWAAGLTDDTEELLTGPMASGGVRLLDVIAGDDASTRELAAMIGYLASETNPDSVEHEAFPALLFQSAEALMTLEDEENIIPLVHAMSRAMAPNAPEFVMTAPTSGEVLDTDASMVADLLDLLSEVQERDTDVVLPRILANAVSLPTNGQETTPLEILLDVMFEINRLEPRDRSSPYLRDDYQQMMQRTEGFLNDDQHGMERLMRVVQNRQIQN